MSQKVSCGIEKVSYCFFEVIHQIWKSNRPYDWRVEYNLNKITRLVMFFASYRCVPCVSNMDVKGLSSLLEDVNRAPWCPGSKQRSKVCPVLVKTQGIPQWLYIVLSPITKELDFPQQERVIIHVHNSVTITVTSHERHGVPKHRQINWVFNSLFWMT